MNNNFGCRQWSITGASATSHSRGRGTGHFNDPDPFYAIYHMRIYEGSTNISFAHSTLASGGRMVLNEALSNSLRSDDLIAKAKKQPPSQPRKWTEICKFTLHYSQEFNSKVLWCALPNSKVRTCTFIQESDC